MFFFFFFDGMLQIRPVHSMLLSFVRNLKTAFYTGGIGGKFFALAHLYSSKGL